MGIPNEHQGARTQTRKHWGPENANSKHGSSTKNTGAGFVAGFAAFESRRDIWKMAWHLAGRRKPMDGNPPLVVRFPCFVSALSEVNVAGRLSPNDYKGLYHC